MNEVYEIGNGQACNTRTNDVCGALDCMHDQKAILIGVNENEGIHFDRGTRAGRPLDDSEGRHLSDVGNRDGYGGVMFLW